MRLHWLIFVAVGVSVTLWASLHFRAGAKDSSSRGQARAMSADIGDTICVPGVDLSTAGRNLIMVSETSCPACDASAGLFDAFARRAKSEHIPVYSIQGHPPHRRGSTGGTSGRADSLVMDLAQLGIVRVPTIVLVDNRGIVLRLRTGSVPVGKETDAVEEFFGGGGFTARPFPSIDPSDLAGLQTRDSVQVVDPRPEGERLDISPLSNARPIALDDLGVRALYELDAARTVVLDCRVIGGLKCQLAISELRNAGFTDVRGVSLARLGRSPACR